MKRKNKTKRNKKNKSKKQQQGGDRFAIEYPSFSINTTQIQTIQTIQAIQAVRKPKITLDPILLSILIMYDPDAVNPSWVHYLIINIPNGKINEGTIVLDYMGPTPPVGSGVHRYIFEQLKQDTTINIGSLERGNFNIDLFRKKYNLVLRNTNQFLVQS